MSLHAYHCVADLQRTVCEDVVRSLVCEKQAECQESAACGRVWWVPGGQHAGWVQMIRRVCVVSICVVLLACVARIGRGQMRHCCAGCYRDMVGASARVFPFRL